MPVSAQQLATGGVLLVDKPAGVSSFAVVNAVRQQLVRAFPELAPRKRMRGGPKPPRFKCGHAGTLDPLATGLLVVLVGKGSRLSQFLLGLDKTYAATVRLGTATDSLDADGAVVDTAPVPSEVAAYEAALVGLRGAIEQVPPVISALKRDGQPLYKLARAGYDVAAPAARPVTIHRLDLVEARLSGPEPEIDLMVGCSSGTYVRSLARDLAVKAGTVGHIAALRRLTVGPFDLGDAVAGVMNLTGAEIGEQMKPLTAALPHLPRMELSADECASIGQGGQPQSEWLERLDAAPVESPKQGRLFQLVDEAGQLVAVGRLDPDSGAPKLAMGIPQQRL